MENKIGNPLDSHNSIRFSSEQEEKACFIDMRSNILKLLYLIEDEQKPGSNVSAELFLFGLLMDLSSANTMSNYKLTKVLVKIHALADNNLQYKTMTHAQIKRQIMESKGILDHLIGDKPKKKINYIFGGVTYVPQGDKYNSFCEQVRHTFADTKKL